MTNNQHFELLGKTGKDRVTGYQGTIISISFDLFGCVQVIIRPPVDKDGKLQEAHWFDVNRVEVVDETRCMPIPDFSKPPAEHPHGPAEKPPR